MASNIFKKGMLCIAFAAALTGCGQKPEQPAHDAQAKAQVTQVQKIDFSRMTIGAITSRVITDAEEAGDLHFKAFKAERSFREGKTSQEEFEKVAKPAAERVAAIRASYNGTQYQPSFDATFTNALKRWDQLDRLEHPEAYKKPSAGLRMDGGAAQELIAELIKIAAGQMAEDIKVSASTQSLGPGSQDAALQGISVRQSIFPGGPPQYLTVLDAAALKAGGVYSYTGKLTINGDLPENLTLNVDGKLVVNGSVASGDKLSVKQPENMRDEKYDCWNWAYGPSLSQPNNNSYHYGSRDDACTRQVPDGLKYKNDPEAAIHVTGTAANNARLYTNGGKIEVDGGRVSPAPAAPAAQPVPPVR